MPSVYSAAKNNNCLFKLKTNRLKGRFVFEWVGFSDDLFIYGFTVYSMTTRALSGWMGRLLCEPMARVNFSACA